MRVHVISFVLDDNVWSALWDFPICLDGDIIDDGDFVIFHRCFRGLCSCH